MIVIDKVERLPIMQVIPTQLQKATRIVVEESCGKHFRLIKNVYDESIAIVGVSNHRYVKLVLTRCLMSTHLIQHLIILETL